MCYHSFFVRAGVRYSLWNAPLPQFSVSLSVSQALPHVCSGPQDGLGFDDDLQQLYASVVTHGNARTRKRKLSETHSAKEDQPVAEEPDLTVTLGLFDSYETAYCLKSTVFFCHFAFH